MSEGQARILQPVAMHDGYGPFLRSFFARYFNPIRFPEEAIERIRSLAQDGTIVYLSRSASLLHFLYMNHVCLRHQLPLARFVNGVDPVLVQPIGLLLERMRVLSKEGDEDLHEEGDDLPGQQLASVLDAGLASLLFLDRPSTIVNPGGDSQAFDGNGSPSIALENSLLQTLIRCQQKSSRPIYLIPHLTIWDIHPARQTRVFTDAVFGLPESPGFLRSMFLLMRHHHRAFVKVAEPVDLDEFIRSHGGRYPECGDKLHDLLEQRLSQEVFDVTGPKIRPNAEFRQGVIQDEKIQEVITTESDNDPVKAEAIHKKAHDMLDEIAADPRIRWPLAFNRLLNLFWKRMYEGIVVEGMEKIRTAVRKSPVVFCPSHKSHVDYLILSQLCISHAVPLPHIAAGVNLSFWPMGPIFRHSGAFFMRRSFKGDNLYPVIFRTYLRHVMMEGYPIEFFIEGTRSRTGKLLNPRFGVLSWLIEAYLESSREDLQFIPISIDYEKIVESRSYVKELSGGEKNKEDVASLVKSGKALKSKYGKIYVQVGDPLSLRDYLRQRGNSDHEIEPEERRAVVQQMANQILLEINKVSTVTPSALLAFSLLTHRKRGMSQDALVERAQWVADWIRRRGHTRFSVMLSDFKRSLAEAASRFSRDGLLAIQDTGVEVVYSPVERKRLALDYYRNNIIHHFVPASICALALSSFTVDACPLDALTERIRELSRLFKFEFFFRSEHHFDDDLQQTLNDLQAEGVVTQENGFVVKPAESQDQLTMFCAVLEHYVEAYWLCIRSLNELDKGPLHTKDFITRALNVGDRMFVQGELMLQESLNREAMKNAINFLTDRGLLESIPAEGRKGPRLTLTAPDGSLDELAGQLQRFLPSRK